MLFSLRDYIMIAILTSSEVLGNEQCLTQLHSTDIPDWQPGSDQGIELTH